MRRFRSLIALLLLTPLLFSVAPQARGDELEDMLKEFDKVQAEIDAKTKALENNKGQQRAILNEITRLERDIKKATSDVAYYEKRLEQVGAQLAEASADLQDAERRLGERTSLLSRRVQFIYERGAVSYLQVLLNSTTFTDFLERLRLLREIVANDVQLLAEVKQERADIAAKKSQYEKKHAEYTELEAETIAQRAALQAKVDQREEKLQIVRNDAKQLEASLDALEEVQKVISEAIRKLSNTRLDGMVASRKQLRMMWPVNAPITSEYGNRFHPILKRWKLHTGIDLGAKSGTKIAAAEQGVVMTAGYLTGYGNTVIILHGDGISTLYGHQSKLTVKKGDKVAKGDLIGYVGSTGYSTGPHLHFEVMINGTPDNPHNWLPKK
ncbi:MAG: murein hydrolase activator EnvC family protein [Chloroflexota bacterium]